MAGAGVTPNGRPGQSSGAVAGTAGLSGSGIGGGFNFIVGSKFSFVNTAISGNTASTAGNDAAGLGKTELGR